MRLNQNTVFIAVLLILLQAHLPVAGQLGISFDIKKPKEYEERVLRSEKSDQKKFTLPRRFIQNTVTHYNYFFNANNKLNEVLERAKESFKDDYSRLLPFYNYSLDVTARDSIQLDSVTYKSSTGIALHDLRNDWTDNLYLMWGAAFYLQKKFDSAYLMFQFINYAYAPKEKDGYYRTIGSTRDGNQAYSIATKEKGGIHRKLLSRPPSRNDAFIWQIRNFLVQDQFAEAASLIVALKGDPALPKRLNDDLAEVQALWFYKQNMWDSAAVHLEAALENATTKQEKARWEYLVAQLYELSKNYKEAARYYDKVSSHTTDPVLDIYARLYAIRVNKDGGEKDIQKNVDDLLKMARRDKYSEYQDIIYYMAAQMQLEGNNTDAAIELLKKSTSVVSNNPLQKNRAFLQLAELSYAKKQYRNAYNFYDSLNLSDTSIRHPEEIQARKATLGILASNLEIADRQDSLQRIAALPEDERKDFVKKLAKELRKLKGLKDEPLTIGSPIQLQTPATQQAPLFSGSQKGEWYFYNSASRSRGQTDFKSRWGNRPNIDNWRRSAALASVGQTQMGNQQQGPGNNQQGTEQGEITFESLYDNLPLTAQQKAASDDSLQNALFIIGKSYVQEIEDCAAGTETFERIRAQFPAFQKMDEVLFNLYYCYNMNGETAKAAAIKRLMAEKYPSSNFTTIVTTGKNPLAKNGNNEATKAYERIYDLFIEGNFNQAVAEKKTADSIYGNNYWTPQLLYIEAVYYIKQRQDSAAVEVLNSIQAKFPNTPLALKATGLLDVLSRRAQIEEELKNLNVSRQTETPVKPAPVANVTTAPVKTVTDSLKTQQPVATKPVSKPDSLSNKPVVPPVPSAPYTHTPDAPHYVVVLLNKVDPVFANETRNAFSRYHREVYYNKTYSLDLFQLDSENRLLLIAPFASAAEAIAYVDKTKPKTASEILPWLKGGKYSFLILTDSNFNLLKEKKDTEAYRAFLEQHFPGKF